MKNKKLLQNRIKLSFIILLTLVILNIGLISVNSQETTPTNNFCCEKTNNGAWCQNTLEENCNPSFRKTPTSCDATSYCKLGCCVDSSEGLCIENTPQKVCEISTGTWVDDSSCNVPQCDLGCCILGDQASFVTLTRCKKLSAVYSLETNFQRNINNEAQCIVLAHSQDKGACVLETEEERTCKFTTRGECLNTVNETDSKEFFKDYLCSSDELGTNCGPTTETSCLEGHEEVYFMDSCNNPANIYDASKTYDKDPSYWHKIVLKKDSCGYNAIKGNSGSKRCGNCEYFQGSICSSGDSEYGENYCKDINCYDTQNGNDYKNGESWCVFQGPFGLGSDLVGSRHFRHVCINGEEIIESCSDYRNEICIENTLNTPEGNFIEAGCRVNRWVDCVDQEEKEDCLNLDKRDCYWTKGLGLSFIKGDSVEESSGEVATNTPIGDSAPSATGALHAVLGVEQGGEACLPNVPAGLKFWESGEAQSVCSLASTTCEVVYEKTLFQKDCKTNCHCLDQNWVKNMNQMCTSLGDCGAYYNLAEKYTNKGVEWKVQGQKKVISGILTQIKNGI